MAVLTAGTSVLTIFGENPETRSSEGILPKMTYNDAGTNVLLTVQHTLFQPKGGRKEKASITFFSH